MVRVIALGLVLAATAARADVVTVHADAPLHRRASARSPTLLTLAAGESADAIGHRGGWVKLRVHGRTGWVSEASLIEVEPAPAVVEQPAPEPEELAVADEPAPVPAPIAEPHADLEVAAGLTAITQSFRTGVDGYDLGVTAAVATIGGAYRHRLTDRIALGGEATYAYLRALPGVRALDPETGDPTTSPFTIHDATIDLVARFEASRRVALTARAGLRSHRFRIAANPPGIPNENRLAPTAGAGVAVRATGELALRFAIDVRGLASRVEQARGMRGTERGAALHSAIGYRWRPGLELRASHDFDLSVVALGALRRYDAVHRVTAGLARTF